MYHTSSRNVPAAIGASTKTIWPFLMFFVARTPRPRPKI
jgi:hypothetical protein